MEVPLNQLSRCIKTRFQDLIRKFSAFGDTSEL